MKNKIVLLSGLKGLAALTVLTFQLTNVSFEKNEQKVNFKSDQGLHK
jgi:hypothetical protein